MTATRRLARYIGLLLACTGAVAALLALIHLQITATSQAPGEIVGAVLRAVFLVLAIVAAIAIWPILMLQDSRRTAREQTRRHTAMLMQEIEARRGAEAALQAAKETAEAASLAKSKYVRGISHELRTPLNAVLGYAQLLEASPALPESLRHSARVIRRSGAHLSDLVNGLLDISMIEAGKLHIYRDEVAFPEFLDQIVDMFSLQAQQKGLAFAFDPPPRLPATVRVDEKRLKQVLINLLSNAIRNTHAGRVVFRVRFSGEVCRFDVEDTGVGIAPEDLPRIFLPFERVETAGQTGTRGAGLGLTITKLLTEGMGGELTAVSTPGAGSVFSVRMLLSEGRAKAAAPARLPAGYRGARRAVLVADDDPDHVEFMRQALSAQGFSVMTACDGPSCLEAAAAYAPDAVLLDISMPGMTGWETAARLRAAGCAAPVVMVSADPRSETQRAAAADEHDAYLMKPLSVPLLLATLGDLLALDWIYEAEAAAPPPGMARPPEAADIERLRELGRIGHVRGIISKLEEIRAAQPQTENAVARLRRLAEDCELDAYDAALKEMAAR